MKKYIFPARTSIGVILDTETTNVTTFDSSSSYIDWTYVAPEDGVIVTNGVEKQVKKGEYILKMYTPNRKGEQPIFILKDPELAEYIKEYNRIYEEERKEHSLKQSCNDCESEAGIMQEG